MPSLLLKRFNRSPARLLWLAFFLVLVSLAPANDHWPQFRGPSGSGLGQGAGYPTIFGEKTNLLWKIEPGSGNSSPVIWGHRLFLTSFVNDRLIITSYELETGQVQWHHEIQPIRIERGHQNGSPATSTPAANQDFLVTYFGSFGLIVYSHEGKELWRKELPVPVTQHGAGSSPVIFENRIYLVCDEDVASSMLCLDIHDGNILWKKERPLMRRGFSTPLIWPSAKPDTLVVAGTLQLKGYDLKSGEEKWSVNGLPNEMVSSPIGDQERIYVAAWTLGSGVPTMPPFSQILEQLDKNKDGNISQEEATTAMMRNNFGYIDANKDNLITQKEYETIAAIFAASKNAIMAISPHGEGDQTTSVLWKQTKGLPYAPSPLVSSNRIYTVKNGGMVSCFDSKTGNPHYLEERVGIVGDYYASPVLADGKLYLSAQQGSVVVLEAGNQFHLLATNTLPDRIMATPALVNGKIYLRTLSNLYSFGIK
ncbi:MAG: hypothetical protein JWM04_1739 [Verrucomicrobiales bacterium]|nr:hypothetical protein [Verrucomicrobiales bacterium]